jgi:hypothetical protein
MANTFVKIQTVTVGSGGAATISFTSIPQTYTDLKLVLSGRSSSTTEEFGLTFNGNGANYASRYFYGNGTSAFSGNNPFGTSYAFVGSINKSTTTASVFNNAEFYIPNYTSANNKSFNVDVSQENNATLANNWLVAGLWSNSAAITTITLTPNSGNNFAEFSTATLYGIKNT